MRVFDNLDQLTEAKGERLGTTDWLPITQERINQFADATGDHQWIHVDTERAASGPFGSTIAHGYLTLSLIPMFGHQIFQVRGITMGINYGTEKVRFPATVPVGSRVRATVDLTDVADHAQGKQATFRYTIEVENASKPACVAETILLYVP